MFDFLGFIQFVNNPMGYASQKLGIPNGAVSSLDQIPQYLMNNGRLTQQQYNQAINQANQLQHNPQFMQFLYNLKSPH